MGGEEAICISPSPLDGGEVVLKVSRWHSVNEPLIASNLWGLSNVSAVRAATPKSLGASDSGRDIYNKKVMVE